VLAALRKNWAIVVGIAVAVTLAVTFYTLSQTKIYQAEATILFDPSPPRPLGQKVEAVVEMGAGNYWNNQEYYATQYKVITSRKIAQAVVSDLGLQHDAAFLAGAPPGKVMPARTVEEEAAALVLIARIRVEPVKDSRLALVKYEDADPDRAQRVLTALVNTYVAKNLEDAEVSTSQAVDWLQSQLAHLKNDLESSEMALHDYKRDKDILSVALDDQSNMLREEMKQLNDALTGIRAKREEIAARSGELSQIRADAPSVLPASELLQSGLLQEVRRAYVEAARDRDALLKAGKGKNHPEVLAAQARVDAARDAILTEVRNIQGALNRDLEIVSRQEGGLSSLFQNARRRGFELNLLEIEYNRLRRAKENNEKLYGLVLERTKESELARMEHVNNIRILDVPMRPTGAIRPRVPVNVAGGLFVGAILGVAAALGLALIDRSIKTPDDVEKDLGAAFIGLLPEIGDSLGPAYKSGKRHGRRATRAALEATELIVHDHPMSGIAEAARAIRTNLVFMAPDHPFRTLLVTSAGPTEGKTTVACCVSVAMAQAGQRVLLIDCDLRKPRVHRIFGHDGSVGVTTAILATDPTEAILATRVPNLSVICAGPIPPNPAELLHSERFKAFLADVQGRFDRVILDSPPIVPVTDAAVLSTLVDGTMLVIRAFKTSKDLARHALRALGDVGANMAGTVLNAVSLSRGEYKYSHYYHYYRREGYYQDGPMASAPDGTSSAEHEPGVDDQPST
jgi:capsular exopolysaccharide synthesis family protein